MIAIIIGINLMFMGINGITSSLIIMCNYSLRISICSMTNNSKFDYVLLYTSIGILVLGIILTIVGGVVRSSKNKAARRQFYGYNGYQPMPPQGIGYDPYAQAQPQNNPYSPYNQPQNNGYAPYAQENQSNAYSTPADNSQHSTFCTACGKEIDADTTFCPYCGNKSI